MFLAVRINPNSATAVDVYKVRAFLEKTAEAGHTFSSLFELEPLLQTKRFALRVRESGTAMSCLIEWFYSTTPNP